MPTKNVFEVSDKDFQALVLDSDQLVDQFVGRQSKDTYVEALNKLINI
jgi:hypothetical protein